MLNLAVLFSLLALGLRAEKSLAVGNTVALIQQAKAYIDKPSSTSGVPKVADFGWYRGWYAYPNVGVDFGFSADVTAAYAVPFKSDR